MPKIIESFEMLYDYLQENDQINCVCLLITPWHLLGAEAFVVLHRKNGEQLFPLFVICETHGKFIISEEDSIFKNDSESTFVTLKVTKRSVNDKIREKMMSAKKLRRKCFVLEPNRINILIMGWFEKSVAVIIDEGLASYFKTDLQWELSRASSILGKSMHLFKYYMNIKPHKIMWKMMNRLIDFCLLDKKDLSVHGQVVDGYKEVLQRKAARITLDEERYRGCILFNTQPLVEDGLISESKYGDIITRLGAVLCDKNVRLILKMHPRETNAKRYAVLLNCCQLDSNTNIAQEVLLAAMNGKPCAIMGFYSTTLVTAKLFYGINAISLCDWIPRGSDMVSNDIRQFSCTFKEFVDFVRDERELLHRIQEDTIGVRKH
ncbi:hypothetical protein CBFG_03259 [Clostridiales bacterium 1_7_47FAA]|nr:hypothetical protein CBFG_03259 [Clostridiales bacterium 1_7_47FAA]